VPLNLLQFRKYGMQRIDIKVLITICPAISPKWHEIGKIGKDKTCSS
jgi:hypothetical protein